MNLFKERCIKVIKENLPKDFLNYLFEKDAKNQIISVSYNGECMLLEYKKGKIKESLKNPGRNNTSNFNQLKTRKRMLNLYRGRDRKPAHLLVKRSDNGTFHSFYLPENIDGKFKKEVILSKGTTLLLTYEGTPKKGFYIDDRGNVVNGTCVTQYKGECNNVFTDVLHGVFNKSYNVWNI